MKKYLKMVFGLVVLDSIFFTFMYSALRDTSLVPLLLGTRIAVDIIFLIYFWRHIKLSNIEMLLIFAMLASCCFATFPNVQYSSVYSISRFFNDISGPLLFILKVSTLRSLFRQDVSVFNIKKMSRALMILSGIQVLIFLYFSAESGAYAGITPPVNIPAAFYICTFNHLGFAATVILIALSGKRSFFVSVAIVYAFTIFFRKPPRNMLVFLVVLSAMATMFAIFGNEKFFGTVTLATEFFNTTEIFHIDFDSDRVRSNLYMLTAGRSEEIYGILNEMKPSSWLIGLGPGFTYGFLHIDGVIEGYANSHFSPLSFIYKFGVPFMLIFYGYIIFNIRVLLKSPRKNSYIVGCALTIFVLQSFFAFNFYAEPYFAILMALGMAISQERRSGGGG